MPAESTPRKARPPTRTRYASSFRSLGLIVGANPIKRRSMKEHILDIPTKDGAIETFVCYPERGGPYPPVLFLMDAPGIRAELYDMARRLATSGYYVLLPNLYYRAGRDTKYGPDVLTQ